MKKKWIATAVIVLLIFIVAVVIIRHATHRPARAIVDGTIECDEISISSKVPGRVQKLFVDEGMPVKPGDTLAILESREIDAKVEQSAAAYQSTLSRVSQAGTALKLQQLTFTDQLKEAQSQYNAHQEDIRQAEEGLNQAKANFKRNPTPTSASKACLPME